MGFNPTARQNSPAPLVPFEPDVTNRHNRPLQLQLLVHRYAHGRHGVSVAEPPSAVPTVTTAEHAARRGFQHAPVSLGEAVEACPPMAVEQPAAASGRASAMRVAAPPPAPPVASAVGRAAAPREAVVHRPGRQASR